MPEFIYQMSRVRKAHGDKVILDDVTLAFLPDAKIGVVGPNGTGKSTLLRMMAGVEHPSNGDARLMPGFSAVVEGASPPTRTRSSGPALRLRSGTASSTARSRAGRAGESSWMKT